MAKTVKRKPKPEHNGQLIDGTIEIAVQGGPHGGETIRMDATVVKLTAEALQDKHKLTVTDGIIEPTAEFALELDQKLQEMGYKSTPTIAIHAWVTASNYFAELQKKTN